LIRWLRGLSMAVAFDVITSFILRRRMAGNEVATNVSGYKFLLDIGTPMTDRLRSRIGETAIRMPTAKAVHAPRNILLFPASTFCDSTCSHT
jgi:hypothetical protein